MKQMNMDLLSVVSTRPMGKRLGNISSGPIGSLMYTQQSRGEPVYINKDLVLKKNFPYKRRFN